MTNIDFLLRRIQDKDISRKVRAFERLSDKYQSKLNVEDRGEGRYDLKTGIHSARISLDLDSENMTTYKKHGSFLLKKDIDTQIIYDKKEERQIVNTVKGKDRINERLEEELNKDELLKGKYQEIQDDPKKIITGQTKYLKRSHDGYKPLLELTVATPEDKKPQRVSAQNSEMEIKYIQNNQ